ncbi:MAG: porin family protein [Anditalea sp.]
MSRIRLVLTMMLFIFFLAGFQEIKAQVKAGVRAGLNYPNISVLNLEDNNGFHVGTYLKISLAGIVALEPGIQYSHREFVSKAGSPSYKVDLNYLEMPLIFRLSIFPFVNIFGGPQPAVLVGKKVSGEGYFDSMGNLPHYEMGGVAGIGIKLPLGFNIQGSYDFGLSHLEDQAIKNRIFKLSLGKDF